MLLFSRWFSNIFLGCRQHILGAVLNRSIQSCFFSFLIINLFHLYLVIQVMTFFMRFKVIQIDLITHLLLSHLLLFLLSAFFLLSLCHLSSIETFNQICILKVRKKWKLEKGRLFVHFLNHLCFRFFENRKFFHRKKLTFKRKTYLWNIFQTSRDDKTSK